MEDCLKNKKTLHSPGENEILDACKMLPKTGYVEILCSLKSVSSTLKKLEQSDFFGITLLTHRELAAGVGIVAFKGKELPCYDTGKTAAYCGGAFAALDDDFHLLCGEIKVCEKTAAIYNLPVYKKYVKVSKGNSDLMKRLESDPVPFECDNFESDVAKLRIRLSDHSENKEPLTAILYPGPFKILLLKDGTMIRRGVPVNIPEVTANKLRKTDACILLKGELSEKAGESVNFIEVYKKHGVLCLINVVDMDVHRQPLETVNLKILKKISPQMKHRLCKMIEINSNYFIMIGSDARDLKGCCPSDGVEEANRLAEAGVLQVARPNSFMNACPVNIYAFSNEIQKGETYPTFTINRKFRQEVNDYLSWNAKPGKEFLLTFLRWSLLLFVGFSLFVITVDNFLQNRKVDYKISALDFAKEFSIPFQDGVLILQFHRETRCDFCLTMEKYTRKALNSHFAEYLDKNIVFRTADMDIPQFEKLREKYELFTSTLLFIQLKNGAEKRRKIVSDAWQLTNNEEKFVEMFRTELSKFIESRK